MSNDKILINHLCDAFKIRKFEVNSVDKHGKSVIHYVVNPVAYGSYENNKLLSMLHKDLNMSVDI
jgi:hypothetical protein